MGGCKLWPGRRRLASFTRLFTQLLLVCTLYWLDAHAARAQLGVDGFALPPNSGPYQITLGPDGRLWFTEFTGSKIGAITTSGTISEFSIPTINAGPGGITLGPDGNLWFTEQSANKIARITPTGTVTEFNIPTASSAPLGITAGPDGNMWFTEFNSNKIGRIRTTVPNTVTEFTIPTAGSKPNYITAGSDGNLWFTEQAANNIGRILANSPNTITEFPIPTVNSQPTGITSGPDMNIWFLEQGKVGRFSPLLPNSIAEFVMPTIFGSQPISITTGPDLNMWFTQSAKNQLGRVLVSAPNTVTEFPLPQPNYGPYGIVTGPDGNLWFTVNDPRPTGKRCMPGSRCVDYSPDNSYGDCATVCDPVAQDCPPPMAGAVGCIADFQVNDGSGECIGANENNIEGAPCIFLNDCPAGMMCYGQKCRNYCRTGGKACPQGQTCKNITLSGVTVKFKADVTGVCAP